MGIAVQNILISIYETINVIMSDPEITFDRSDIMIHDQFDNYMNP